MQKEQLEVAHSSRSSLRFKEDEFHPLTHFLPDKDGSRERIPAPSMRVVLMSVVDSWTYEIKLAFPDNHCWRSP